jgi:hypothetical protein
MAMVVQNDDGDEVGANSYLTVAAFKTYHDNRGNSYSDYTDSQIEKALVKATDYIDTRFIFKGIKLNDDDTQTTQWPRKSGDATFLRADYDSYIYPIIIIETGDEDTDYVPIVGSDGRNVIGIPTAVEKATAEYAYRALSANLFQDAPAPSSGRLTEEESVQVDVISQSIKYAPTQGNANYVVPAFPQADLYITRAGLTVEGGRVISR